MKRLHVHISVDNLAESVRFYSALFFAQPAVTKPEYAKWMLDDPRVNFAISQRGATLGLNHLGIQVESPEELADMRERLQNLQSSVIEEKDAACCYAKSDKYWATDPQGIAWETFHTLDNIPVFGESHSEISDQVTCCIPLANTPQKDTASCCVPIQSKQTAGACC